MMTRVFILSNNLRLVKGISLCLLLACEYFLTAQVLQPLGNGVPCLLGSLRVWGRPPLIHPDPLSWLLCVRLARKTQQNKARCNSDHFFPHLNLAETTHAPSKNFEMLKRFSGVGGSSRQLTLS